MMYLQKYNNKKMLLQNLKLVLGQKASLEVQNKTVKNVARDNAFIIKINKLY